MHSSKIRNFVRSHSGTPFPKFRTLTSDECAGIRKTLSDRIASQKDDGLALLKMLDSRAELLSDTNAEGEDFCLLTLLRATGVVPGERVYLNWYRLDDIDEFQFEDVSAFFGDIWYPGSDDLEILDGNLRWILFVHHTGDLKFTRLPGHSEIIADRDSGTFLDDSRNL